MTRWDLIFIFVVLTGDGHIVETEYQDGSYNMSECSMEANARVPLFDQYIGENVVRTFSATRTYICTMHTGCQPMIPESDPRYGTREIKLPGKLIGYKVGCRSNE